MFVQIGLVPNTEWLKGTLELSKFGEIIVDAKGQTNLPGVFAAGEMLDWEAPTGGYLLTACFASGRQAAQGVVDWLAQRDA